MKRWACGLTALLLCAGCAGAPSVPQSSPRAAALPSASAPIASLSPLRLGHYASADGLTGFILDRTAPWPKLQMDGAQDIIELRPEPAPLDAVSLKDSAGLEVIRLTASGEVIYFRGPRAESIAMRRDHDAPALGVPTIRAGASKPSAEQLLSESLEAVSVRKRFPQFSAEDSVLLGKVTQAIEASDPTMVVQISVKENASASFMPAPNSTAGYYPSDEHWNPKGKGLLKFGAELRGFSEPDSQGNHIKLLRLTGYPPPLAPKTPGLIWEVQGNQSIVVTFDGGRYLVDNPAIEKGLPAQSDWPLSIQHDLLTVDDIGELAKLGVVPSHVKEQLEHLDDQWNQCSQKAWAGAKRELTANQTARSDPQSRDAREKQILERWNSKVRQQCASAVKKMEQTLLGVIEARDAERQRVLQTAKARFK